MDRVFNDIEASEVLGLHVQTLRNWRATGKGPVYVKQGRSVRYYENDLEEYKDNHKIVPRSRGNQ